MPRTNQDGKDIKIVLEWLCRRHLSEDDLAEALDVSSSKYGRRKNDDDFPSFEELGRFANHLNLSARALQIAFGYLDPNRVLLDDDEMRQYVEQGGGEAPFFQWRGTTATRQKCEPPKVKRPRFMRRDDAPPGP